jgi:hypothetical protein
MFTLNRGIFSFSTVESDIVETIKFDFFEVDLEAISLFGIKDFNATLKLRDFSMNLIRRDVAIGIQEE